MGSPSELLEKVYADNRALLYRCRWSEETARAIVPALIELLDSEIGEVTSRALRALFVIGDAAASAAPATVGLLGHTDPLIRQLAVSALGQISFRQAPIAVPHLVAAAAQPDLIEPALVALIRFGVEASDAVPLFVRTYESRDPKLRRLAVRGLKAAGADDPVSIEVLDRALADPNADVRKAARSARGGE